MNPETELLYQTVVGLYQGLLGRAPEIEGLEFWMDAISSGDLSFQDLIDSFAETPEFETVNPGLGDDVSSEDLATIFYQNLLGRTPDAAGLDFWTDLLASGTLEPGSFTAAFLQTPEADDRLGEAIDNYIEDAADGTIDNPGPLVEDGPQGGGDTDDGDEDDGGHHTPTPPPFVNSYGNLGADATFEDTDEMHAGKGNPSNGFALSVNEHAGIELGLDARYYKDGDEVEPIGGVFEMTADRQDDIRFAYSVSGVDLDAHDYRLFIDTDGGPGQAPMEFTLVQDDGEPHTFNNSDSPYDWLLTGTTSAIEDDGGNADVTQNIQALQWYSGSSPAAGDEYDIRLAAYEKGTSNLLAETEITIQVNEVVEGITEDFNDGASDMVLTEQGGVNYGAVSVDGDGVATFKQVDDTGPFTQFDGYRVDKPDVTTTAIDILLVSGFISDTEGFSYSVAASRPENAHLRDFIFHVANNGESLVISSSNNATGAPQIEGNFQEIDDGWYTFRHTMYENGDGDLEVKMEAIDRETGLAVFTDTRSTVTDDFDTAYGGNRYGWFTNIDVNEGIKVDNWTLEAEYF